MDELFDLPAPDDDLTGTEGPAGRPRLQRPDRDQVQLRATHLDALLPADHRARLVWGYVEGLDLSGLEARVRSVEGGPGRPAIDPAILMGLWLYATLEGVGSARALERLCDEHDAYRWLCGGVGVNHHTLADFRVDHVELLDDILTTGVAALIAGGLVTMERVAQDGMRVRASAGDGSFRRRDTLEAALADAEAQVRALRAELDDDPAATSRRVAAARERAARERLERVREALGRLPALEAARRRKGRPPGTVRVSTTDPGARVTKMADGGWRPAWNAQLATDAGSGIIVGADIARVGVDHGELAPMVRQLRRRYGRAPGAMLADGGFVNLDAFEELAACGVTVYAPPKEDHRIIRGPADPSAIDTPVIAGWRARMATPEALAIYRGRASAAEWTNAGMRNRGLHAVRVRGRDRVRACLLWQVLAHNLMRITALRRTGMAAPG